MLLEGGGCQGGGGTARACSRWSASVRLDCRSAGRAPITPGGELDHPVRVPGRPGGHSGSVRTSVVCAVARGGRCVCPVGGGVAPGRGSAVRSGAGAVPRGSRDRWEDTSADRRGRARVVQPGRHAGVRRDRAGRGRQGGAAHGRRTPAADVRPAVGGSADRRRLVARQRPPVVVDQLDAERRMFRVQVVDARTGALRSSRRVTGAPRTGARVLVLRGRADRGRADRAPATRGRTGGSGILARAASGRPRRSAARARSG